MGSRKLCLELHTAAGHHWADSVSEDDEGHKFPLSTFMATHMEPLPSFSHVEFTCNEEPQGSAEREEGARAPHDALRGRGVEAMTALALCRTLSRDWPASFLQVFEDKSGGVVLCFEKAAAVLEGDLSTYMNQLPKTDATVAEIASSRRPLSGACWMLQSPPGSSQSLKPTSADMLLRSMGDSNVDSNPGGGVEDWQVPPPLQRYDSSFPCMMTRHSTFLGS
ncbi:MAG: hypothetical protein WDW38_006858 [Sanguina aurantia]